jgi:hypothetical protein
MLGTRGTNVGHRLTTLRLSFLVALAVGIVAAAHAQAPPTKIYETVPLGQQACTITIVGGDVLMCVGQQVTVGAQLECPPGYARVQDPQWFLGTEFLGTGDEITLSPPSGSYTLTVACGSCENQNSVIVQDEASCSATPRLDALFSNDETEATTGIFMQINEGPITPETFAYRKYLMRPFTLAADEQLTGGQFVLSATGANLEVYYPNASPVLLPAVFDVTTLPQTVFVNATALGEAVLTATYQQSPNAGQRGPSVNQVGVDEVKVRVGTFPGLAGSALTAYPFFEFVAAVNDDDVLRGALDPGRHAERLELPYRAYVVAHRTPEQWAADNQLSDVSGGFELATVTSGSIAANTLALWTSGLDGGALVGKPYDVIYDFGGDGRLDPGDLIDRLGASEAGVYIVRDLNQPGPNATNMIQYSGGTWLGQRTYFPAAIATMGQLPLVVISHGNGHMYTWYDYLGHHLASHGYVVMAHENNTSPGIESASTTTLSNTDYLIGHQGAIGSGVLNGHIDSHRITWIGHSRGGEGVVRAYIRIMDGAYVPEHYGLGDIVLMSSIAPTVFLGTRAHEVNYHLMYGAADGDVEGSCDAPQRQPLRLAEAANGNVQVTYLQGAGHNDFNCCGWADATGPDLIGRDEAQRLAKSYYVALLEHYIRGNVPARDYLTRMYGGFHPSGIADQVVCANTYRDALATDRFVIDNYQANTGLGTSSSGGAVTYSVSNAYENRLDDENLKFTWTSNDPMNGMTRSETGDVYQGGVVFDWTSGQNRFYELEIVPNRRDFRTHEFLSFRTCQGTRHTETLALNGPLTFTVTLRDGHGTTSSINFSSYGAITRPYQRTGIGTKVGWANEFNTVRLRLCDFENNGSGIDLADIVAVRFEFGTTHGSARGRIGIDDVELSRQ